MDSLQGHLLIASPRLVDPNFFHTVVLLVQHNEEGALGVVLNRPLQTSIKEVWEQVTETQACEVDGTLNQGGPCEGPLMVIHKDDIYAEIEVMEGIYFCTRRETIEKLVDDNSTAMKFFVGYAGWTAGQLENEIEEGSWLSVPGDAKWVFDSDEHVWTDLVRRISRAAISQMVDPERVPDDPSVN